MRATAIPLSNPIKGYEQLQDKAETTKKGRTKARDKPTRRVNKTTHRACSHKRRLEERETTVMNEPSRTPALRAIQYPSCKAKFTW